jgi:hypothetical protein
MSGVSRHCPTYGGAMAKEEEANNGSKDAEVAREAIVGEVLGPEIGQAEAGQRVQKAAQAKLLENIDDILTAVVNKAKKGDLKSLKVLLDCVFKLPAVGSGVEIPLSFAAELWVISEQLLEEAKERDNGQDSK